MTRLLGVTSLKRIKKVIESLKANLNPPEDWRRSYDTYYFSRKELITAVIKNSFILCAIVYSFYRSFLVLILGIPVLIKLLEEEKNKLCRARKQRMGHEFMDGIKMISSNLNAGYSIENAFKEAAKQLVDLYGEDSDISREFLNITKQLELNIPLAKVLGEFAERSNNPDILLFANNIRVAKQSGGNLKEIIGYTAHTMEEKVEVKRAIESMVAAKRLEHRIMCLVPVGIIIFINVSSPGFLDVLYHNPLGWIIMTACLGLYYLALRLGDKILNINM